MSLPGASATSADGSIIATQLISGKEYAINLPADNDGHIIGSRPDWMVTNASAVTNASGAEVLELFNAQASTIIRVRGVWIIPTQASITGIQVGYDLNRISTVGSTSSTVETPRPTDTTFAALPAGVTARKGSTAGATLVYKYLTQYNFNEETAGANQVLSMVNLLPVMGDRVVEIVLRTNEGLQVKISTIGGTAAGLTAVLMYFVIDN